MKISQKFYIPFTEILQIVSILMLGKDYFIIMKNVKKKQILSMAVGVIILSCTFLGTFQFHKSINCALSLLKTAFVYPSIAILEVNDFIKDISSAEDKAETVPVNKKEQSNKTLKLLFLILSTMLVSNEKLFLMLLIMVFAAICMGFKKTFNRDVRILMPPDIKFYLWWRLKFLTPLQKCILNRSNEYDINLINMYGWALYACKKTRILLMNRMRVFFMYVKMDKSQNMSLRAGGEAIFMQVLQFFGIATSHRTLAMTKEEFSSEDTK